MNLKYNVNKIHGDLISRFSGQEIKIEEKSNLRFGNYVEINIIKEGKEAKIVIPKIYLENSNFNWGYYSNPLLENSHLVERNSSIENFSEDVFEIFEKNRFDKEYLESLTK